MSDHVAISARSSEISVEDILRDRFCRDQSGQKLVEPMSRMGGAASQNIREPALRIGAVHLAMTIQLHIATTFYPDRLRRTVRIFVQGPCLPSLFGETHSMAVCALYPAVQLTRKRSIAYRISGRATGIPLFISVPTCLIASGSRVQEQFPGSAGAELAYAGAIARKLGHFLRLTLVDVNATT
ncbi:hypothetical protein GGD63_007931 [Bradyrhizobium sp. cir1]|nr:hypothetical protein [Bradyrhizobium sp. cir1]